MSNSNRNMCDEDLRDLIRDTVRETLTTLGIEATDPFEAQRDFQFLRDTRKAATSAKTKAVLGLVGLAVTGLCAAAWVGIKSMFGH